MDGSNTDLEAPTPIRSDLGLVGTSDALGRVRRDIRRFGPLPAPVLVMGPTGSGKELVANALHAVSPRAGRQMVATNAATFSPSLIASELFGHVRGAFTGAYAAHRGVFEQADGTTLFLDETADLPLELQAWLLRVLETGEVRPLGAERCRRVDVRVVAATAVDLEAAVRIGRFRADLYWRLAVLTIRIPPLVAHTVDVVPIAKHLLADIVRGAPAVELSPEALQLLVLHEWPGNVRELRAVLTRAVAMSSVPLIESHTLTDAIGASLAVRGMRDPFSVDAALAATGGNVAAAARLLGVPRSTLRDRVRDRTPPVVN